MTTAIERCSPLVGI